MVSAGLNGLENIYWVLSSPTALDVLSIIDFKLLLEVSFTRFGTRVWRSCLFMLAVPDYAGVI